MTNGIGMMIDVLVAFLLVLTIGYCMMLNRRLKRLKADEQSLRATISELVTATEIAERAIGGLKLTVHECDMGLGERLRKAERVTIEIDRTVASGKDLLGRLSRIVTAGRGPDQAIATLSDAQGDDTKTDTKTDAKTNAKSVAAAAQAFAERLRTKVHGLAA
jgi:Domain of unknown function (DUF6468)